MIINKTHSKAELINIIKKYNVEIDNPNKYKKIQLSALLVDKLNILERITPTPELPFSTLIELKHYLLNVNPKKTLTIKQKNEIVMKCKKIKHYCENNYNVKYSFFSCEDELVKDIELISKYGSIPSVRLAIRKYNLNPSLKNKVDIVIPEYVQRELDYKHKLKNKQIKGLEVKTGKFILHF